MDVLPLKLQAARVRLKQKREYTASLLLRLKPVKAPGLGTIGVDDSLRLYFDPSVEEKYTTQEFETILYHEVLHIFRRHCSRGRHMASVLGERFQRDIWNCCVDATINEDIAGERVFAMPANATTLATLGELFGVTLPAGKTPEELYDLIVEKLQQDAKKQAEKESQEASEAEDDFDAEGEAEDDFDAEGEAEDDSDDSGSGSESNGVGQDDGQGKAGEADGQGEGPDGTPGEPSDKPGDGQPSDEDGEGGAESQESSGGEDDPEDTSGKSPSQPKPMAGDDGSVQDGAQRPWEQPKARSEDDGATEAEQAVLIREMAHEIDRVAKSRGDVPAHLRREAADELSPPKVPWYRVLAGVVRAAVSHEAGCVDFTYSRESRRHEPGFILPGTCQPEIHVAVVVDTSGSMGQDDITRMLSEIKGILKSIGQRNGLSVLSCDAEVHTCQRVLNVRQVQTVGGGGTDMGRGIEAALKCKPQPDICVVLTDGYTPWPDEAPRGMKVIVGYTDREGPAWAKNVHIDLTE